MPGRVPEPELHRAFARASVLVLPSIVDARGDTEGLGVVLLEAMSYRIPVIASKVGGITDIVADGETGLLVAPQDSVALAGALERLAADPRLAERLAEAGRRYVQHHFSWPAIVDEWLACYAAALDTARGRAGGAPSSARPAVNG
jgi:glycosyltransferase involved in cell wall biosynthesis